MLNDWSYLNQVPAWLRRVWRDFDAWRVIKRVFDYDRVRDSA